MSGFLGYFDFIRPRIFWSAGLLVTTAHSRAQNLFAIDPDRLDALLHKSLPTVATNAEGSSSAITPIVTPPPTIRLVPEMSGRDGVVLMSGSDGALLMSGSDGVVLPELQGDFYQTCLARIHTNMRPRTYLEIGTLNGDTLALSSARSIAIDPAFQLARQIPGMMPSLFLFQGPSDEFFEACDPKALLGGAIDLAFLDGMHQFEFLLRDFMNTERYCHRDSVILLHDCIPLDLDMAGRDMAQVQARTDARHPGWWTGDVWKTVDLLMQHRPDLDITAVDASPTGLIIVRNLDPTSTVLSSGYQGLVESYRALPDYPAFLDYIRRLRVVSTAFLDQMIVPFTDLL